MRIQRTGFGVAFLLLALTTFIGLQSQNARAEITDHLPAAHETSEQEEAPAHDTTTEHDTDPAHPGEGSDPGETSDHGASDEHANAHHSLHLDGSTVSVLWCIPFIGILLSIAILPLVAARFWHHHYGKVSLFWGLSFFLAFSYANGIEVGLFYLSEVYLGEFIPFIVLLLALFTVSGGILLKGSLRGTPVVNTGILLIGTILASWMGTTGAAMLLIRPLIRANSWRKKKVHIIVFFIFLVANVGGSLTPLGDPPLFLGFLKGVSFFWTTQHLIVPMMFVSSVLLLIFYFLDVHFHKSEEPPPDDGNNKTPLSIEGQENLLLLPLIIGAVVLSGVWHSKINNPEDVAITLFGTPMLTEGTFAQVSLLLLITIISVRITKKETREENGFTWEPIVEVAKLFATIFLTMVPAIAILKAGTDGALAPIVSLVTNDGQPVNSMYFWCTGVLSSFLDNAPTYVVFFNTAGGDAVQLMGEMKQTLIAISCGAVFMGANTYIGNAPNFMVKSIAEENDIDMPSFFGYMAWSCGILVPVLVVVTFIFF
ncbi:MAG: sodium:proton antiporter [Deltaproteobacteria bacterium]|nr:sodium:proton antiporter [Deltaproteobacteria bacterium]